MATNQQKFNTSVEDVSFIRRVVVENQLRIGHLVDRIVGALLDAPVKLEGGDVGTTNLRRKLAWLARNFRDIVLLCKDIIKTQDAHTVQLGRIEAKLDQLLTPASEAPKEEV